MTVAAKGLSDEKATRMMAGLREGRTLRKFWVSKARLEVYLVSHPDYAREARPLLEANAQAARLRKGLIWRERTKTMCLKGLHPMSGSNLLIDPLTGRRRCSACHSIARANPRPIDPVVIEKIKQALRNGASIGQICWGRPVGGGKIDRSLVLVGPAKFYHLRKTDRAFDQLVAEAAADSNIVGQRIRWSRIRTRIRTSAARNEMNDYHAIRAMLPASFPGRDDVVSNIFEDILSGSLKREDVKARVQAYVAAHNQMFPTRFAKFGDSPLVSLDEVMFDQGSATRGDTVTRGLWD